MEFEGVSFNETAIAQFKKEDFIERHKGVLWQDREPEVREKMLSDVYDTITGKKCASPADGKQPAKETKK